MLRFFNLLIVLVCLVVATANAASPWTSYAYPSPFQGAALASGKLWIATPAGVRSMDANGNSELYSSEDGLQAANQQSVFALPDGGVVSLSAGGLIARKTAQGNFQVVNRSFAEAGRTILAGRGAIAWPILVLPFNGSLAFYDLNQNRSLISLVQIGGLRLEAAPVTASVVRDDTLWVALGGSLFRRTMVWDSLANDRFLADPSTWNEITRADAPDTILGMAFRGDSLMLSAHEGTLYYDAQGKETSACLNSGCVVKTGGTERKEAALYRNGASLVKWVWQDSQGRYWFVGAEQAWIDDGGLREISAWSGFPLSVVHTLAPDPAGGVVAWSHGQITRYRSGQWETPYTVSDPVFVDGITNAKGLYVKSMAVGFDSTLAIGSWGTGLLRLDAQHPMSLLDWYTPPRKGCLTGYDGSTYTLVRGIAATPDSSGFLFTYVMPNGTYGLGFLGYDGTTSCQTGIGSSSNAGLLAIQPNADGLSWSVFVGWGASLATDLEGGIDHYLMEPPAKNQGSIVAQLQQSLPSHVGYPRDMELASDGTLWVAGASSLGFWQAGDTAVHAVTYLQSYNGGELTALEVDVQNNIWLGTRGKGAYRLSMLNQSPDSLTAVQILPKDGLLSSQIYDIAIDARQGVVWFGLDVGLSAYRYSQVRDASKFMTAGAPAVKVYPNPFRPRDHAAAYFENVREDAIIYLLDAGGNRIRTFQGNALKGGRLAWDGTNSQGKRVAPGLYHYWIVAGGKTARGKLVVEF